MTTQVELKPVLETDILPEYAKAFKTAGLSIDTLPQLDLQGRQGHTDYIDFLTTDDMTRPVMKFIDRFNRPGVAIHIVGKPGEMVKSLWSDKLTDSGTLNGILALFQRYTGVSRKWSFGWGGSDVSIENTYNAWHQTHGHQNESKIMACDCCPFPGSEINTSLLTEILNGTNPILTLATSTSTC